MGEGMDGSVPCGPSRSGRGLEARRDAAFWGKAVLVPVQGDSSVGTGGDAGSTAVATAGIDKWWFTGVNLHDRLAATHVTCLAFTACQAQFIHDMWNCRHLRFGGLHHRHLALHPSAQAVQ